MDIKGYHTFLSNLLPLSDFVCRTCQQYPSIMHSLLFDIYAKPLSTCMNASDSIEQFNTILKHRKNAHNIHAVSTEELDFFNALRIFRHTQMARLACLNLLDVHDISTSMKQVSLLADFIISQAYQWLHAQLLSRYTNEPCQQDMQILAMGKLGGHELNFSSDIDLIFAYPKAGVIAGSRKEIEYQSFFTKLAQKLIKALDSVTEHGRCYRVDMRLRPLGESGPLVMSFAAFESYYQEQGRAWERFAMQKMRIVNVYDDIASHNDLVKTRFLAHCEELKKLIKPFVYRKYIDFTTLDSIREMKRSIQKEVRRRRLANNLKLGEGGIREIEFFSQSFQLIHAGRMPDLQVLGTMESLRMLSKSKLLCSGVVETMSKHYIFLRQTEHYLQIFNDAQTQTLPEDDTNQTRLCYLMQLDQYEKCKARIAQVMQGVHKEFNGLIEDANTPSKTDTHSTDADQSVGESLEDLWELELSDDEFAELVFSVFPNKNRVQQNAIAQFSEALFAALSDYKQKLKKRSITERGMRSVNRLMPKLIGELIQDIHPNRHLLSIQGLFDILSAISGRVTYMDLLLENPDVRGRLNNLCRKSAWVASQIAKHPILLDELLYPIYLESDSLNLVQFKQQCSSDLRQSLLRIDPNDQEVIMEALRQFKHAYQLRVAASDISGTLAVNQVSDRLTILAEVLLEEVLNQAWRQLTNKHGFPTDKTMEDKGFAIVAYGKFGGIELSYGSDLDIVCLYDLNSSGQTDDSGERKSISHQQFYVKLVQLITHYCTTRTYQGVLYEIDLRLRPSGNSGLLISHISSFAQYQMKEAWTWEHQALVRSRLIIASTDISAAFNTIRSEVLSQRRESESLRKDIVQMRQKMRNHLDKSKGGLIDIKQSNGGIVDIEFIVQYWVLQHSHNYPSLHEYSDNLRIIDHAAKHRVIDAQTANNLQMHYLWLRHLGHRMQLSERSLAEPSKKMEEVLSSVKALYKQVLMPQ
ncbi:bifunctional [glutamate--ammonia ligase]-adenylyl-L-tyrosine phosphorylase/[glutamate--ammonia-ligase] adenylyltransferase [Ningiella sp. W23]|uniref:bifunctional [glutamate--ammonia ligase]-adenylyl-L-tyrosine phosphorylase/[glutamate--ammonia-ligase] adenylyltransferase n=1 Tax=Ningiella sp. W23 TaxID=3023715 RepID=UPI003757DF05